MRIFPTVYRLTFMRDVFAHIGKVGKYIVVPITLILNSARSATDVMGSYALAAAVNSIATNNSNPKMFGEDTSVKALLYISACCLTYSRIAPYLIRFVVASTRKEMAKGLMVSVLAKTHRLSYEDTITYQNELEQAMNYTREMSELVQLIPNNIHQPLVSIIVGSAIIFSDYGSSVGAVFLSYAVVKSASGFIAYTALHAAEKIRESNEKFSLLIKKYKNNLSNADTIKIFHGEDLELKIAGSLVDDYLSDYIESVYKENLSFLSTNILPTFADFVVVAYIVSNGDLSSALNQLVFLLNFLAVTNANSSRFIEHVYISLRLMASYDAIQAVLNLPDEDHSNEKPDPNWLIEALRTAPKVNFERVFFRYDKSSPKYILRDVSLEIGVGQHCALVGNSSCGKSTLVKLLLRQYRPESGTIRINGRDINTIPAQHLYRVMSFLSQDVHLFENDTVEFNVAYGFVGQESFLFEKTVELKKQKTMELKQFVKDEGVEEKKADSGDKKGAGYETFHDHGDPHVALPLLSFIVQNPQVDYKHAIAGACIKDTNEQSQPIKASALSGGQKQRVAFARSLVRQASILIFDEPTSALDSEIEASIMETIRTNIRGRTSITIAHRLNTIIDSDKIIVLDDGQVVQEGTHNDLVKKEGKYKKFWEVQTGKVAHQMALGGIIQSAQQLERQAAAAAAGAANDKAVKIVENDHFKKPVVGAK